MVENYMTADGKFTVPDLDHIAGNPCFESIGEHMKGIVKLLGMNSALLFTPSALGVRCN